MKFSIATGLVALAAFASAAPADHVRRAGSLGHHIDAPRQAYYYPTGTGTATGPIPTGVLPPYPPHPTGTGVLPPSTPVPTSTSNSQCPADGSWKLVCNGPNYFGLCNFGSVVWQHVSDGTACINNEIVGVGIYAIPTPWPPVPTGYYTTTSY